MYKVINNWLWFVLLITIILGSNRLLYFLQEEVNYHNNVEFEQSWKFDEVCYTKFGLNGGVIERFWAENLIRNSNGLYYFSLPKFEMVDQNGNIWIVTAKFGKKSKRDIIFNQSVKIYPKGNWLGFVGYLSGEKLYYRVDNKQYSIYPFTLTFQDKDNFEWYIAAKQANGGDLTELLLSDKVKIRCLKKELNVDTDRLKLNLIKKLASTNLPLHIKEKETEINAVGGKFWLTNGVLELLSKIKISYDFAE